MGGVHYCTYAWGAICVKIDTIALHAWFVEQGLIINNNYAWFIKYGMIHIKL